jgi:hypothetical protein
MKAMLEARIVAAKIHRLMFSHKKAQEHKKEKTAYLRTDFFFVTFVPFCG